MYEADSCAADTQQVEETEKQRLLDYVHFPMTYPFNSRVKSFSYLARMLPVSKVENYAATRSE
jgi:hypothetical protein